MADQYPTIMYVQENTVSIVESLLIFNKWFSVMVAINDAMYLSNEVIFPHIWFWYSVI